MPLVTLLRVNVNQAGAVRYERAVQRLAAAARDSSNTFAWSARVVQGPEGIIYGFISPVESYAALSTRETIPAMARRLCGESAGDALLEEMGVGIASSSFSILRPRDDLSTAEPPEQPAPLMYVTQIRVRPGGQAALEALIRKVVEAAQKVGEERRTLVADTAVGLLGEYQIAQLVDDPAILDRQKTPPELLIQAFGEKEGAEILQSGTASIEQVVTSLAVHRPDLSNGA